MWLRGWAERNAGNITVRLLPEQLPPDSIEDAAWLDAGTSVPEMAGEKFLITGTGKFLRNVEIDPEHNLGVIEVDGEGARYRIVWGLTRGGRPASELPAHLRVHAARVQATGGADRVVMHTHTENIVALTYALDLDSRSLTRLLWEMHTECLPVFPAGCGLVKWLVPGGDELARATADVMRRRSMAVWQYHGIVAAGPDLDAAFGLIHTAEKAAGIYMKAAALGPVKNRISVQQLRAMARAFNLEFDPEILDA